MCNFAKYTTNIKNPSKIIEDIYHKMNVDELQITDDTSSLIAITVIHINMGTVQDALLCSYTLHIIHTKIIGHPPKMRFPGESSSREPQHPGYIIQ